MTTSQTMFVPEASRLLAPRPSVAPMWASPSGTGFLHGQDGDGDVTKVPEQ